MPMKIFVHGHDLRGHLALADANVDALADFYNSAKRTYYPVDFEQVQRGRADGFIITDEAKLDWLLEDTEILERNLYNDPARTELLQRALGVLEQEQPLNRGQFTDDEAQHLRGLNLATFRPGEVVDQLPDEAELHRMLHQLHGGLGRIFFYTAGKTEARVWEVEAGEPITSAAGRIHSDLERGFIRAEVFNVATLAEFQTVQEARTKGLMTMVDRSYAIQPGDVIDVKFNV